MNRLTILPMVMLFVLSAVFPMGRSTVSAQSSVPAGVVYAEGDRLMVDGKIYIMKGFNYLPRDYGWTSIEDWDWEAVDRELALAASLHANTIRTGVNWQYATGNINYRYNIFTHYHVRKEHIEAIEKFLQIADKYGMKVVLWSIDAMYWEFWDPAQYSIVDKYLTELVTPFIDDPRIAAWDLATDLDGTMLQRPPYGGFGTNPFSTKEHMLTLLRNMSKTIRKIDPNHLQAVGFCWVSSSVLVQDFTDIIFFQFLGGDRPEIVNQSKLNEGAGENYINHQQVLDDKEAGIEKMVAKLQSIQAQLKKPMPIVPSEYGIYTAEPMSSKEAQKAVYEAVNEAVFLRLELAGLLNWALTDFNMPPKAFTILTPDSSPFTPEEKTFGVFDIAYNPKPAAKVAAKYYIDRPPLTITTQPNQLEFQFSRYFIPGSKDPRKLSAAFDTITFYDAGGNALATLDIGSANASAYLGKGFYADEKEWGREVSNFTWAGGDEKRAFINFPFPPGVDWIEIHAYNQLDNQSMMVLVNGEEAEKVVLKKGWAKYKISVSRITSPSGADKAVYGIFDLAVSGGDVHIQTSTDGQTWQDAAITTPLNGIFAARFPLERSGQLSIRAVWDGNKVYQGAESNILTEEIPYLPSAIRFDEPPAQQMVGMPIQINGALEPAAEGETIHLRITAPDGAAEEQSLQTAADGRFSFRFTPDQTGEWTLEAAWEGDARHSAAAASIRLSAVEPTPTPTTAPTATATPPPCTLSCRLSADSIRQGETVLLTGELVNGEKGSSIEIEIVSPVGEVGHQTIPIDEKGSYRFEFTPDRTGTWQVTVRRGGSADHALCQCQPVRLEVTPGRSPLLLVGGIGLILLAGVVVILTVGIVLLTRRKKPLR